MRNSRSPNQRIPVEGKFGQGRNGYDLNYIRARTYKTSEAWIRGIFLVMNLLILLRFLFVRVLTHTGHHVAAVLEAHIHWLHTITIRQTGKLKQSSLLEMAF